MAGSKICPNCGAKNPSSNRFCEDCGYDMDKTPTPSPAPEPALFCPNGHTVSATGFSMGFCDVCGEKLVSEKPVVKPIEIHLEPEPLPPTPTHGKKCPECGTINPEGGAFCEECGHPLVEEAPLPPVSEAPIVISPPHPPKDPLPDIPDIMRPMTNNDMKR